MEERFTFAARHHEALERQQRVLEALGYTCHVEETTMTRHEFKLLTLVAVPPARPNRKARGCEL